MKWPKKILPLVTLFFCLSFDAAEHERVIKLDSLNRKVDAPVHFRSTKDRIDSNQPFPSKEGLAQLNISGSGQFSEEGFKLVLKNIAQSEIALVDLRNEAHGFIDGIAFSFSSSQKDVESLKREEEEVLNHILKQGKVLAVELDGDRSQEVFQMQFHPHRISTEEEMSKIMDIKYERLPISKNGAMQDEQVDRFVKFIKSLPEDGWVHFHCDDGECRTTLFMVMCDMVKNGKKLAMEDIIYRQAMLGGTNLLILPSPQSEDYAVKKGWLEFISQFYNYCRSGQESGWSAWKAQG